LVAADGTAGTPSGTGRGGGGDVRGIGEVGKGIAVGTTVQHCLLLFFAVLTILKMEIFMYMGMERG
jgi:hypothetical protein